MYVLGLSSLVCTFLPRLGVDQDCYARSSAACGGKKPVVNMFRANPQHQPTCGSSSKRADNRRNCEE